MRFRLRSWLRRAYPLIVCSHNQPHSSFCENSFGYWLNYLIRIDNAVMVDLEATDSGL